jgi:hypothetical protein
VRGISAAVMAMRNTFSCACTAKVMALKPTPMAKVMAEGAEELKMGRLNLFIQTPMMVIKNEKQSVFSISKNYKRNYRVNT